MATKQSGLLATLGKRMLGFNTSSTGCCAAPPAATETDTPEAKGAQEAAGAGCCGSTAPTTPSTQS